MKVKLLALCGLLAIGSLMLVITLVEQQTLKLATQERVLVNRLVQQQTEHALRHYVDLARAAIRRLATSDGHPAQLQRQALNILAQMRFGNDGYFFVYDRSGRALLDPEQMQIAGVAFCEPDQPTEHLQANLILATARDGGGLVRYDWKKPSSQAHVPKMSYVLPVGQWGWVVGAGMYLDDIESSLRQIDQDAQWNIQETRHNIYRIAAGSILLLALGSLLIYLTHFRHTAHRLRHLAQRVLRSETDERARVARELHDGVMQVMVSSKYLLETARLQLDATPASGPQPPSARQGPPHVLLEQGLNRLNDALEEIRRVALGLRPAQLTGISLPAALQALVARQDTRSIHGLSFCLHGKPVPLSPDDETALFRVAQEAISNAQRHARPSRICVNLTFLPRQVTLEVHDDGSGFSAEPATAGPHHGMGLCNMRGRIEDLGGTFLLTTGAQGTRICASFPLTAQAADAASPPTTP